MELSATAAFAVLIALLIVRLGWNLTRLSILLPGAAAGYLAADLVSGLVHYFCDNFFAEDSPLIGALLIHPFREHHRDPLKMTTHGFLELTGNSCLGMLAPLACALCWSDRIPPLFETGFLFFCLALFATNQIHKWAHADGVPRAVRWLQEHRIILRPSHHQVHHQNGYGGAYCITCGWMNRPLDRVLGAP